MDYRAPKCPGRGSDLDHLPMADFGCYLYGDGFKGKNTWNLTLACILGFLGIYVLLYGKGLDLSNFEFQFGHYVVLISALSWSIYSGLSAKFKDYGDNFLGVVFFAGCLINMAIWISLYGAIPTLLTSVLIITIYSAFDAFGHYLWNFSMRLGNAKFIDVVSFLIPVLSTLCLVVIGAAPFTIHLVIALALIMAGIGIAKIKRQ